MILKVNRFYQDTSGLAAIEVALTLPILLVLLLGVVDTGNVVLLSKKTTGAAGIAADLLTRGASVNATEMSDALMAARMAIDPFDRAPFGLDVAAIQFQGVSATPTIVWRQTFNMTPNADVLTLAAGLGLQGEGVMVVTTRYLYQPVFTSILTGDIALEEVAVTRGRRSSFVAWE